MTTLELFFENQGLKHIGTQIFSHLEYKDLEQLRKVSKSLRTIVDRKLHDDKMIQLTYLQKWSKTEQESMDKFWPEWAVVRNHFTTQRKIHELAAFIDVLARYLLLFKQNKYYMPYSISGTPKVAKE